MYLKNYKDYLNPLRTLSFQEPTDFPTSSIFWNICGLETNMDWENKAEGANCGQLGHLESNTMRIPQ